MDGYVDITDAKYTAWLKRIAAIRFCYRLFVTVIFMIILVMLTYGLAPYIKGTEEWEDMPFTLSQLEAIMSLLLMCWLMRKAVRVYSKW